MSKSFIKINKIWKKLALGAVITVLFVMLISNIISQYLERRYAISEFEEELDSVLSIASLSLEAPLWNLNNETIESISDAFFENKQVSKLVVKDKTLGIIYEKAMSGKEHETSLLVTKLKGLYRGESQIGSVELTMTKYYINQHVFRNLQSNILEMTVLGFLLIMILLLIIKRITKPLEVLRSALLEVAENSEEISQINAISDDEIGELTKSFNEMSVRIHEARQSIRSLNEELEHKVELRTNELNVKNLELQKSLEVIRATEEELLTSNQNLSTTLRELREVQDLLVESGKMALLGELVAGVAHEINTPIGVSLTVSSFVEREVQILLEKVEENTLSKTDFTSFLNNLEESAGSIVRNLLRAGELITSFKQVAVDQTSHSVRRFNLKEYVDETLVNLRSQYKNRKIEIVNKCPSDLMLVSYPGAYAQVLTNLMMNSLLHAFDQDSDGRIEITCDLRDGKMTLEFTDNGRGISPDYIKKVFNPFFTTKRGHGGTGLGLNITYNIAVNILKGTITCESEVDKGTTFIMTVPLHHPDINESLY